MKLEKKIELLKKELLKYKKILIAYSGGVDSSLLLKTGIDILGNNNIFAVTSTSSTYTKRELEFAKKLAKKLKVKHIIIKTDEFENKNFLNNTPLRCYWCKKELFEKLSGIKKKYRCDKIITGANYDDIKDFRPGTKAEKEYNIGTPLKKSFFTKEDIRTYSKQLGLETYDFPSLACLASRIPYNERITKKLVDKIGRAEDFLFKYGFRNLRVRTTGDAARLEVDQKDFDKVMKNKNEIIIGLKKIGYKFISLDLEGFRSGSMNIIINKK